MKHLSDYYANNPYRIEALGTAGDDYIFRPTELPFCKGEVEDANAMLSMTCHGMSKACGWSSRS
jgi:hypothetical protein